MRCGGDSVSVDEYCRTAREKLAGMPNGEYALHVIKLIDSGASFAEIEARAEELHLREAAGAILCFEPRLQSEEGVLDSLREYSELVAAEKDFRQLREPPTPCANSPAFFETCLGVSTCPKGYTSYEEAHMSELIRWVENRKAGVQ